MAISRTPGIIWLVLLLGLSLGDTPRAQATGMSVGEYTSAESEAVAVAMEVVTETSPVTADPLNTLEVSRLDIDEEGASHTHFQQYHDGIRVVGGQVIVHLDVGMELTAVTENLPEGIALEDTTPELTAEEAYELAWWASGVNEAVSEDEVVNTANLTILPMGGGARLSWQVDLGMLVDESGPRAPRVYVDAKTGEILSVEERLCFGNDNGDFRWDIEVTATYWSNTNKYYLMDATKFFGVANLNGHVSRSWEVDFTDSDNIWGQPGHPEDVQNAGVDAMWAAMKSWEYFHGLGWDGWDDNNGPREYEYAYNGGTDVMGLRVHFGSNLNNGFWDDSLGMISLGDGDGSTFGPSMATVDLVGHEWTHGVNTYTAQLGGNGEADTLNESWSDVFGEMIESTDYGNDWKLFNLTFEMGASGTGYRNMSNPHVIVHRSDDPGEHDYTLDDDPDHFLERYTGTDDSAEEHINTGISNKAFYLLAATGTHSHHLGGSITGIGLGPAEEIWFKALLDYLPSNSTFADARKATYLASVDLYGVNHTNTARVLDAWNLVGITNEPGEINLFGGTGSYGFSGDSGPATSATMKNPTSIDVDYQQNLYIADTSNNRIRRIAPTGIITTIAGGNCQGNSGDGGAATSACLNGPQAVAVDPTSMYLYIADTGNNRIRRVDLSTMVITHFAGNIGGASGSAGEGGDPMNAYLNSPRGIAVDIDDVYISDTLNHTIRRVNLTSDLITRVAGTVGVSGDSGHSSPGTGAKLNSPTGLGLSSSYLYIADTNNHRVKALKLSGYYIYNYAGTGTYGYNQEGTPATSYQLDSPHGVVVGLDGAVYIADSGNDRIRRVTGSPSPGTNTTISTFAGTGNTGSSGDNGPAASALFNYPVDLCVDRMGNIFVADQGNKKVRKVFE